MSRLGDSSSKAREVTEDEKLLMQILIDNSPIDLIELKGHTGLIDKKWDKLDLPGLSVEIGKDCIN